MKKTRLWGLASILAAGALIFGAAGCDSGNDEYVDETPTTWYSYASSGNGACTAKWTFATDTSSIGANEVSWTGKEIAADEGEGATLVGGDPCMIKWVDPSAATTGLTDDMGTSAGRIQAANKTASLEAPETGASLILTTTAQTNITVRAKGAGAATSARIFIIRDADGNNLVYKNNLYSSGSKFTAFHVQGAPAGTYTIYFNGSTISEIDCNAEKNDVTEPQAYTSNNDIFILSGKYIAADSQEKTDDLDSATFKVSGKTAYGVSYWLDNGYPAYSVAKVGDSDTKYTVNFYPPYSTETLEGMVGSTLLCLFDSNNNNITNSAAWYSSDESVATVSAGVVTAIGEGSATIKARAGRFYQTVDVKVTEPKHTLVTTFNKASIPADSTVVPCSELSAASSDNAKALLKTAVSGLAEPLVTVEESASISFGDVITSSTNTDNAKSKGPGNGIMFKDSGSSDLAVGTEFLTLTFVVTPVSGKSVVLDGVTGLLNCGKGTGVLTAQAIINDSNVGEPLELTKNNLVSYNNISSFGDGISISEKTTIKLVIKTIKATKGCSLQVQDIGLTFSESN